MAYEQTSTQSSRTTRAQRAQVVERFQQSGLSQAVFAQRQGLPAWKLRRWLAEAKRVSKTAPPALGELKLVPLLSSTSATWAMEVVSARGLTIRCREALPVRELTRLLRD